MKTDQVVVLVFLILGAVSGIISVNIKNTALAGLVPLAIFAAANLLLTKFIKSKRLKLIFLNSFATFFPVWLIVWIFLFNLR